MRKVFKCYECCPEDEACYLSVPDIEETREPDYCPYGYSRGNDIAKWKFVRHLSGIDLVSN